LKKDGGFPDLTDYCLKKLKKLDPKYKTEQDFNNYTPDEEKAANADVLQFLKEMNNADRQLKQSAQDTNSSYDQYKEN